MSQKKSSHGNLRIRKFPVVRKYLRIRNFPVVRKKIYGSVSEAGELGLKQKIVFLKYCNFTIEYDLAEYKGPIHLPHLWIRKFFYGQLESYRSVSTYGRLETYRSVTFQLYVNSFTDP